MAASLVINYRVNSQSIDNNTSNVTVSAIISWTYGSFSRTNQSGWLTIDGTTYNFSTTYNTTNKTSGSQTLFSKTVNVNHNADGSKKLVMAASYNTGGNSGTIAASATRELAKIPRAASITSAPNFNDEANPVIKYSNPAGTAATTLQAAIYSSDGSTAYASYRDISKTGTSYTFSLTSTERNALRNAIPNSKSMNVRFYVRTVIGGNTYTDYLTKSLSITNGNPTLNPTVKDIATIATGLTGNANKLIKYISDAQVTFNAIAVKGASIKSLKVVNGSKTISSDGIFHNVESGAFTFTVTDSRGFTNSYAISLPIVNYTKLTCGLANTDFNTDGVISFNIKGNYFNSSFGAVNNTLSVKYRYKVSGGSYGEWVTVTPTLSGNTYTASATISGLDYRVKYVIQAQATDKLGTISSSEKTMSCVPVFDWGENDFNFNVPVNMGENVHFDNGGTGIRGTTTSGIDVQAFAPCNGNNNCVVGYGAYAEGVGGTNVYGNEVNIISNDSVYVNGMEIAENKVLWDGEYYMTEGQTITLSEAVSKQATGIVLVFSRYNPGEGVLNEQFNYHFVPKQIVALQSGKGSIFPMSTSNETFAASKYLYISDGSIKGHANNDAIGTGNSGVTFTNNRFVLRYVIGI